MHKLMFNAHNNSYLINNKGDVSYESIIGVFISIIF